MNLNKKSILFILLLFSSLLIFNLTNITSKEILKEENPNYFPIKNLRTSQDPIAYEDILRSPTSIRRFYDTINITLKNLERYDDNPDSLYIYINITYSNNTLANYSMTNPTGVNYSYWLFTPSINDPTGLQNVTFQIFNSSWDILNDQTTKTDFTILNNLPQCAAYLNTTKIYRNQFLDVNLNPSDTEDPQSELNWTTTIIDQSENGIKSIGLNISDFLQEIDSDFSEVNAFYRIKVNITDADNNHSVHYFPFEVINSPPQIEISTVVITPEDRGVKRSSESIKITLNVTDIEDDSSSDVDVKLRFIDTNGVEEQLDFINNGDGSYELEFDIEASKPMGWYDLTIIAEDQNGGTDEHLDYLIVENNPPEILGYQINNMSTENDISIRYGLDLVFTFNVSDIEEIEGLGFVKVCLFNSENEWYNVSNRFYENGSLTIRTVDLIKGKWLVYIFIIDADGAEVGLNIGFDDAPQEIEIIPDISPIIMLIFIISGIILGFGLGYLISSIINSRKREEIFKTIEEEKVKKIKPSDKKKKIVKKKDKKITKKPEDAERDEETALKEKPEEEELKQKPQLKIKRKIR